MDSHQAESANPSDLDDLLVSLVEAVARKDESALWRLYELTVGRANNLALTITGNHADAEEVVCDLYLNIWEKADRYDRARGTVLAWLLVICRSLSLDHLRRRYGRGGRRREETGLSFPERATDEAIPDLLAEADAEGLVHRALSQLPEGQRQLIAMAFFRGLSHSEIALAASLPLGTVKTTIRRGVGRLREMLEENNGGFRS